MYRLSLIVFGLLFCFSINAQEDVYRPTQHFVYPKVEVNFDSDRPTSSEVNRKANQEYIFQYAYSACYDTEYNLPLWVSHHLNSDLLEREYNDRPNGYPSDEQYPNLKSKAFSKSGYDHGHLAPAADFQWSKTAYLQSFLMTNMAPQHGCLNQKGWCHLEGTVRKWAEENDSLDLYIVSGAVVDSFIDTLCLPSDIRVYVPKYFYKVILGIAPGGKTFAIGYLMPNEDVTTYDVEPYETSVRDIEEMTNLDFFSFLPRKVQDEVETVVPEVKYFTERVACPDRDCEGVYGNRVSAEERDGLLCK